MQYSGKQQILVHPDTRWSIGTFSVTAPQYAQLLIDTAEKEASPIGLCVDPDLVGHDALPGLASSVLSIAEQSPIPVEVVFHNLRSIDSVRLAVDLGFRTIVFDGSFQPFPVNLALTAQAAETAHRHSVSIEGKIGAFGDFGKDTSGRCFIYRLAERFVRDTDVDSLVISIPQSMGRRHNSEIEMLESIGKSISGGISLDEATGLFPQEIITAVAAGVTRFYFTLCANGPQAGSSDISAEHASLEKSVRQKLRLLGSAGLAVPAGTSSSGEERVDFQSISSDEPNIRPEPKPNVITSTYNRNV